MTPVPLPASPCLRARFIWNEGAQGEGGIRLYFSYAGSAPTAANCSTLASDFAAAWATHLSPVLAENVILNEVDVLDIATDSGLSGQASVSDAGAIAGATLPWQCSMNVEFDIARRYRGGKPRCFLPPTAAAGLADDSHWSAGTISSVNTAMAAFVAEIEALSVGAVGALAHVNLSYYQGVNTSTPPWRGPGFKYPPKYRAAALLDTIEGYGLKAVIGSQKRRRTSTTP